MSDVCAVTATDYVLAMARELYGRTIYTHRVHEKEREMWSRKASKMNYINLALISATTLFAVISAIVQPKWSLILTAVLASATTAFVVGQSSFDPVGKENRHRIAAKELLWLREQLLLLIERCHLGTEPADHLQKSLESLTRELTAVYKFSPDTSQEAYVVARTALNKGEFTFSDTEIDAFLPGTLRKNKTEITGQITK
jgi:hypothetical protein